MAKTVTVPVQGTHVRRGSNPPSKRRGETAASADPAAPGTAPAAQGPPLTAPAQVSVTPAPAATPASSEAPAEPAAPLSVAQQFHPDLDPTKFDIGFNERGKLSIVPKGSAQPDPAGTAAEAEAGVIPSEPPASTSTGTPAEGNPEMIQLSNQVGQLTQAVGVMMNAMMNAGLTAAAPAQPAQPAAPDYSQLDLYDPVNLAGFIKTTVQDVVKSAMEPHTPALEGAKWREQYIQVQTKYGTDPTFKQKANAAIQMVQKNTALTIEQAYEQVEQIAGLLSPAQTAAPAAPAQPAAPPAQPATRTISTEQAAAKADQARRFPAPNSGVKGAGRQAPPAEIRGLGQLLAWNLTQAGG